MPPIVRSAGAVIAGAAAAIAIISGVQALSASLYPPPVGLDYNDAEAMRAWVASLPAGALLLVLASYLVGALAGGFVAARLAPAWPTRHAAVIAGLLTVASLMNLSALPHPAWFWVANLAIVAAVPMAGARLGERHAETASGEV